MLGKHKPNLAEMTRYCVLCEKEYGPHLMGCCTHNSVVAMRREGLLKKRIRYFALDGEQLDKNGLSAIREIAVATRESGDRGPIHQPKEPVREEPRDRWNWAWPTVETPEAAARATRQAFWAAALCAAVTAGLAALAAAGVRFAQEWGFDWSALFDTSIFLLVAWGLWRHSRAAAWAGLVLYIAERAFMWSEFGIKNPVVAAIFILVFVGGVRGTSALYRMKKAARYEHPKSGAT